MTICCSKMLVYFLVSKGYLHHVIYDIGTTASKLHDSSETPKYDPGFIILPTRTQLSIYGTTLL